MKLRIVIVVCCLISWSVTQGQMPYTTGEFIDERDGKVYQTIKIDSITWLGENMKFNTENLHVSEENDFGIRVDDYYYPYEEADGVCPNEFRIPRLSDWEGYIRFVIALKNIPKDSIEYFDIKNASGIIEAYNKLLLFDEPNPLNLSETGLIQGTKLISDEAMNFWSRKDESADTKYHLHILTNYYFNHTHKHHIKARKKKKRKFVIRCVKDVLVKK